MMNVQQKRKILLYKDSIDKIITNGIQPNLVKLEKSAKIIRSVWIFKFFFCLFVEVFQFEFHSL